MAAILSSFTGFKTYGFADPIYAMVKAGFGIDGKSEEFQDRVAKANPIPWLSSTDRAVSLRRLLETLGTEWGRNYIQEDLWTRLATKFIRECSTGVIIRDVRFRNEVEWLDSEDGLLVHIVRPHYHSPDATVGHLSNIPLTIRAQDYVIMNDCSLEMLEGRVHSFVSGL